MSSKHSRDDDVDDQVEKKRRRVVTPAKSSEKMMASDKVDTKMTARVLFHAEENEVLQRDANEDINIHKEVVDEIQSIMLRIHDIKKSNLSVEKKKASIEKLKNDAILHFVSLKRLNRMGHLRTKRIREVTQEAKQKVDRKQLSLQNLLYELMHLQREISKCVQFKSMDEEISLVSQEEFLEVVPKEISEQLLKENDAHKMMVARLDWELKERKALSAKYADSLKSKEAMEKEIEKLKMNLKSLSPMLSAVLESTKPIQDHLEMPFQDNESKQKVANHLPPPLYFLFIQASSYGKACDKDVSVEIVGDVELAHSIEKIDSPTDVETDSDEESEATNKVHRRSTTDSRLTKKQEQLLKRHPLTVNLVVTSKGKGSVTLSFQHLVNLEFVVASATVQVKHESYHKNSDGPESANSPSKLMKDLFEPLLFLDCLYDDDDDGEETPNPENVFKLAKLGITDLATHLKGVGRPYRWVQKLCGLQSLKASNSLSNGDSSVVATQKRKVSNIEELVESLKKRFNNRLELFRQLDVLEGTNEKPAVNWMTSLNFTNVPKKISSQLVQWRSSSYDEFLNSTITKNVIDCELACNKDFFFFGVLERTTSANGSRSEGRDEDKATMSFFLVINPDYPNSLPLFCIKVNWGSVERSALNHEDIRELESSVNLRSSNDLDPKNILLNQVALLCTCFDVYLETGGLEGSSNKEATNLFEGDKSYLRLTRGPTRCRPYRYVSKLGFFGHF